MMSLALNNGNNVSLKKKKNKLRTKKKNEIEVEFHCGISSRWAARKPHIYGKPDENEKK